MYGIRESLGVDSVRLKVERRALERIGHVLRMPNDRLTKRVTLGWMKAENSENAGTVRGHILGYYRKLVREAGMAPENIEKEAKDRDKWRNLIQKRLL